MNTQYFIYAIEVEKTGSITQAAKPNLFMSQPTLSKAIRDMESSVGFPSSSEPLRASSRRSGGRNF